MKVLKTEFKGIPYFLISNLPVVIALIMMSCVPFFLLQNEREIANQFAGYAYYLLVVGVLWKIFQYLMNMRRHEDEFKMLDGHT